MTDMNLNIITKDPSHLKKIGVHVLEKVRYTSRHIEVSTKALLRQPEDRVAGERDSNPGQPRRTRRRARRSLGHTVAGTHVLGAQSPMSLAMPFIDNDLLWSSDHDGKMVGLSSCLQDASVAVGQQNAATGASGGGLGELSQTDLSSLVPPLPEGQMNDADDIFKHLSDTTAIEIESILSEFSQTPYIKVMLEMRKQYTMAAANPILAEKLSTPSEQNIQHHTTNGRPHLAPLTPKVEKGNRANKFRRSRSPRAGNGHRDRCSRPRAERRAGSKRVMAISDPRCVSFTFLHKEAVEKGKS
ncbi:hypothetical protein NQ317_009843 [Molorchus minor]|uniref:Uncharacterized protein n=1 Tax=Molorchus minor TaxID=1323400 RepID=A0ABQ9K3Q0_9CUCU|nr:hypothetical protein NQ317_009843 [Molorchus minor]